MKKFALPLVILALVGAFVFWWFSPAQVVKRRSISLLETLTLEAGSGNGGRQLATFSLNALLAEEVELAAPSIEEANGTFPRSELESAFSWLCTQAKQTRFELEDVHSVAVEGDRAEIRFTLSALVELSDDRPVDGRYEVTYKWWREKDGWRLVGAKWTEME